MFSLVNISRVGLRGGDSDFLLATTITGRLTKETRKRGSIRMVLNEREDKTPTLRAVEAFPTIVNSNSK